MVMLSSPIPRAWNTEDDTMVKPPTRKQRLKVFSAGTPMANMASEARKMPSSLSGQSWKITTATTMIPTA